MRARRGARAGSREARQVRYAGGRFQRARRHFGRGAKNWRRGLTSQGDRNLELGNYAAVTVVLFLLGLVRVPLSRQSGFQARERLRRQTQIRRELVLRHFDDLLAKLQRERRVALFGS